MRMGTLWRDSEFNKRSGLIGRRTGSAINRSASRGNQSWRGHMGATNSITQSLDWDSLSRTLGSNAKGGNAYTRR